jgi:tRNA pseudouridine38-40 synthase
VYGAGRTDAGVHAWGQVANFAAKAALSPEDFLRALNALLPPAVRIRQAEEVGPNFQSRRDAEAKTYIYRVYRGRVVPPFHWRYVLHDCGPLDFAAMAEAARAFVGEHDFTSFAASSGSDEIDENRITRRTVYRSEMLACGFATGMPGVLPGDMPWPLPSLDEWTYVVRGRSFLRHMVRKIMGTLMDVGRGRLRPSDIPRLIESRDRTQSGPTVPPQGLCLISVEYPDPANSLASPDRPSV